MKLKEIVNDEVPKKKQHTINYKWEIVWKNVIIFTYVHVVCLYGLYLTFFYAKLWTFIWRMYFFVQFYKLLNCIAYINTIIK